MWYESSYANDRGSAGNNRLYAFTCYLKCDKAVFVRNILQELPKDLFKDLHDKVCNWCLTVRFKHELCYCTGIILHVGFPVAVMYFEAPCSKPLYFCDVTSIDSWGMVDNTAVYGGGLKIGSRHGDR
jgi:hypothetical protein